MPNEKFTENDVIELINIKTETKNLDYKEKLNWLEGGQRDEKLAIIADILAMANTMDGGRIIFGVKDKTFEPVGLSGEDFKSFDTTTVSDLLGNYAEPKIPIYLYKFPIQSEKLTGNFIVIDVPEFSDTPIICKKSAHSSSRPNKQILKEGAVYVRTDKATTEIIPSYFEMKDLLTRAIRKNSDELLRNIKNLINGGAQDVYNKDNEVKIAQSEVDEADGFFRDRIDEGLLNFGFWKISVIPVNPSNLELFNNQKEVKEKIKNSKVELRGWDFPHTDRENVSNFNKGFQSHTIWERYIEGYRAYQSGVFVWKRAFWEDVDGRVDEKDQSKVMSFISAIWSLTEFLLFFSRYYRDTNIDGVILRVEASGVKDRKLVSLNSEAYLDYNYISSENIFIYDKQFNITQLFVENKEIAKDIAKKLFMIFNCELSDNVINNWQDKLIDGKN